MFASGPMALSKALKLAEISMVTALWKVSLLVLVGPGDVTLKEAPIGSSHRRG